VQKTRGSVLVSVKFVNIRASDAVYQVKRSQSVVVQSVLSLIRAKVLINTPTSATLASRF